MSKTNSVKICRACLSETFSFFNIYETLYHFNKYQIHDKQVRVAEIYERLTGNILNENDENLPKNLCLTCLEKLYNACEFLELCKRSEKQLHTYNKSPGNDCSQIEIIDCADISFDDVNSVSNDPAGASTNSNDDDDDDSFSDEDDPDYLSDAESVEDNLPKSTNCDTRYECMKCNELYNSTAQLRKHEKIHRGNWKCSECDKILANKYSLRHHMVLHTGKPHECIVCRKRFAVLSELTRHTKIYHKNGKSYVCDQCPKRYYTKSHLTSHKLIHLNRKHVKIPGNDKNIIKAEEHRYETNEPKGYIKYEASDASTANSFLTDGEVTHFKETSHCETESTSPIRNFPFSTSTNEDQNADSSQSNNKHSSILKIDNNTEFYRCKTCFKKFRHKTNYLSHMKLQLNCKEDLNTNNNPQKCDYCSIISDNVYQLRKHLETHLDKDPFKCKLCEKTYKTWVKLSVHTRQTHLTKTKYRKSHLCTLCGRGFFTAKLLDEHYLAHQGIRKYKCDKCDSSFCTVYGLKQHATIHTRDALQCSECGKILANKMSLKSHMTIHFGKKYQCTICEKYFPNPATLNRHMKSHRGERNYVCDRCSKRYTCRGHLNEHIKKIHENPTTLKCDECGNEFAHRRALKKHVRLEHAEKKVFNCDVCGKTYGRKSRLKEHKKKAHTIPAIVDSDPTANQIEQNIAISLGTYNQPDTGIIMVEMFKTAEY